MKVKAGGKTAVTKNMIFVNYKGKCLKYLPIAKKLMVLGFLLVNYSMLLAQSDTINGIWSLQQCIDRAFKENITLNQSLLGSDINRLTLAQSKANRLPNLNAGDTHINNWGRSLNPLDYQYINQSISYDIPTLTSNVTLYNGSLITNTIKQNKLNYDAGNLDVEAEKNAIELTVLADYMQVLLSYEQLDNTKAQVQVSLTQVNETQKFVDAGKYPESNLLQIKSQLAADKLSEVNAENQLQLAKVALEQIMLLPVTDGFEVVKPDVSDIIQPGIQATANVYKVAESFLPQIKSAALKTQSAMFGIKIARSQEIPNLVLGGTLKTGYSPDSYNTATQTTYTEQPIGFLQSNNSDLVLGEVPNTIVDRQNYSFYNQLKNNFTQQVSLTLTVSIFNNKLAKTAIEKAKVNTEIAQLNEEGTKVSVRQSVEQAVTDEKAAEKQYIASKEAYASEELTFHNMEIQFKAGKSDATDFLVEKNNDEKALANLVLAKYNYIFKIKIVDFYLGKPIIF